MSMRLFDHLDSVELKLHESPRWLLGLDFDGTLAPIVADPADAQLEPRLFDVLSSLSAKSDRPIIIVSGRERVDVEARIGLPGLVYAGNHGLDIQGGSLRFIEATAAASMPALNAMADTMTDKLRSISGVIVEHKGLTLSVHYRMVSETEHEAVRLLVHHVLASTDHPFVLTTGKCVFEIRPRTVWNKGAALTWIQEQICPDAKILYIGDDRTDEDAFRVCTDGIAIRVGHSEVTAAGYYLDSQSDVLEFLLWFAARL